MCGKWKKWLQIVTGATCGAGKAHSGGINGNNYIGVLSVVLYFEAVFAGNYNIHEKECS